MKKDEMLVDEFVEQCREDWNPKQYDLPNYPDWGEAQRGVMKAIAKEFYAMSTEQYRQVLYNTRAESE